VLTLKSGRVSWIGRDIKDQTATVFTSASESLELEGKFANWLERFDAKNSDHMLRGYSFGERPIDIMRALDTFCINAENALADVILDNETAPYTAEGQALIEAAIQREYQAAVDDGYGVPESLKVVIPPRTAATDEQRQLGIWPDITGSFIIQAGIHKIVADFTLEQ